MSPEHEDDVDAEESLITLYHKCVTKFNWSLRDIDETNLETLIDFLFFKEKPDENTMVINGKTYKRAESNKPPSWL